MVLSRSGGNCEAMRAGCTFTGTDFHHRVNRGMGTAQKSGGPEACLLLCAYCHQWVTTHPKFARELGYLVLRNAIGEPADVPVRRRKRWVLLDEFGGLSAAERAA